MLRLVLEVGDLVGHRHRRRVHRMEPEDVERVIARAVGQDDVSVGRRQSELHLRDRRRRGAARRRRTGRRSRPRRRPRGRSPAGIPVACDVTSAPPRSQRRAARRRRSPTVSARAASAAAAGAVRRCRSADRGLDPARRAGGSGSRRRHRCVRAVHAAVDRARDLVGGQRRLQVVVAGRPTGGSAPVMVTAATCGSRREPVTVSSSVNGVTNSGSAPMTLPFCARWSGSRAGTAPGMTACPSPPSWLPLVISEYRGGNPSSAQSGSPRCRAPRSRGSPG